MEIVSQHSHIELKLTINVDIALIALIFILCKLLVIQCIYLMWYICIVNYEIFVNLIICSN